MSVIMLPTWNLEGITLNAVDDDGVEWIVDKDEGWDTAPGPRLSMTDKPAGDGSYDGRSWLEPRTVVLSGRIIAPTRTLIDQALRTLAGIGIDGGRSTLTVTEPDRTLTAEVRLATRTDVQRRTTTSAVFQLSLIAPDPRKYGADRDVTTGLATAASGGVLWNGTAGATGVEWNGPAGATGVRWQSGSGTSGIVTVTNDGNTVAPLTLTFTAGSSGLVDPAVTDVAGNAVISYGGTIPAGSTLVIDTDSMSVLLDGANRGPLLTRADPITVPRQGSAQLLFTATSGPTASLLARVRDTYV